MEPAAKAAAERIGVDVDVAVDPVRPRSILDARDETPGPFDALWRPPRAPTRVSTGCYTESSSRARARSVHGDLRRVPIYSGRVCAQRLGNSRRRFVGESDGVEKFVVTAIACALPRRPDDPPALDSSHRVNVVLARACTRYAASIGSTRSISATTESVSNTSRALKPLACESGARSKRRRSGCGACRHPFFISTLFHPHRRSHHPFIAAFVEAAATSAKIKASLA